MRESILGLECRAGVFVLFAAMMGAYVAPGCRSDDGGGDGGEGNGGQGTGGQDTSSGGAISGDCAAKAQAYVDCGILQPGVFNCKLPAGLQKDCELSCTSQGACEDLTLDLCGETKSAATVACENACKARTMSCTDGSTVAMLYVCNGYNDCPDGADESNCPTFQCASGQTIGENLRCDGTAECPDGSDEANCPTFQCGDGSTVAAKLECNLVSDCNNGADEHAQCARAICP